MRPPCALHPSTTTTMSPTSTVTTSTAIPHYGYENSPPIPIPTHPAPPTLRSVPIAATHKLHTPQWCVVHLGIQYWLPSRCRMGYRRQNWPQRQRQQGQEQWCSAEVPWVDLEEGYWRRRARREHAGGQETSRRRVGRWSGRWWQMTTTTDTPFWASRKELRAQRLCPESWPYDILPTRRCPPRWTPISASPAPPTHPSHPRVMDPPLFRWGNMTLQCATALDALVAGSHYLIPIPAFSTLYLPLQCSYHLPDLATPILNVRESNSGVVSYLGPHHRHENRHWHLPAPLSYPTDILCCPTARKLFAWMYRDHILLSTTPAMPAVGAHAHRAQFMSRYFFYF